jgi:hypothetical protein
MLRMLPPGTFSKRLRHGLAVRVTLSSCRPQLGDRQRRRREGLSFSMDFNRLFGSSFFSSLQFSADLGYGGVRNSVIKGAYSATLAPAFRSW